MEHVAALTKALEIAPRVVAGIVIEMGRGENDMGRAQLVEDRTEGRGARIASPVPPLIGVEPAPVRQAKDIVAVRPAADLAAAAGTFEANARLICGQSMGSWSGPMVPNRKAP